MSNYRSLKYLTRKITIGKKSKGKSVKIDKTKIRTNNCLNLTAGRALQQYQRLGLTSTRYAIRKR